MAKPVRLVFLADDTQLRKALGRLVTDTSSVQASLKALQKTGNDIQKIGRTMSLGITLPTIAAAGAASFLSAQYESTMLKIQTLAGASKEQVSQWSKQLLALGPALGKTPEELAQGLYFIVSSGASASDALGILKASAKASAAGLGDTQTVANAVTTALNAYGSSNLSAARATDILLRAVKDGKAEAADLAQSIGLVVPVAAQLHVGFDQIAGGMAALTQTGSTAAEASTQLRNIFTEMLHPSSGVAKELKAVGLSSAQLQTELRQKGLLATLQDLHARVGDNETAVAKLFPNIRGLLGVLSLVGPNGQKAADVFRDVAAAGGDVNAAFDATKQTRLFKWHEALASLAAAGIKVGDQLAPAVAKITGWLNSAAGAIANLDPKTRGLIITIVALVAAMGPLLYVTGSMLKTFASLARHPLIAMIALLVIAFITAYTHSAKFRDTVNQIAHALASAAGWVKQHSTLLMSLGGALGTFLAVSRGFSAFSRYLAVMRLFGVGGVKAVTGLLKIGPLVPRMFSLFSVAWRALNASFLFSPIGIIVGLILALVVAFYIAYTRSKTFRDVVNGVMHAVTVAVKAAVNWIVKAAVDVWHWIDKYIVGGFRAWWAQVQLTYRIVSAMVSAVVGFFSRLGRDIIHYVSMAVNFVIAYYKFLWRIVTTVASAIWSVVGPVFKGIAHIIMWAFQTSWAIISGVVRLIMAFVIPMMHILHTGWMIIWNKILDVIRKVDAFVRPWITAFVDVFKYYWNLLVAIVRVTVTTIWNTVVSVFNSVKSFFTALWAVVVVTFHTAWNTVWTLVKTGTTNVWNTIVTVFNNVRNFLTGLWNGIVSFFSGIWNSVWNLATRGAQRVFDGMMNIWNRLSNAVSGAFSSVGTAIRGAINWAIDQINRVHIPPVTVAGVTVFSGWSGFNLPHLANGGLVTAPTVALIGEAGKELVLPLTRKQRAMELLQQSGLLSGLGRGGSSGGGAGSSAPAQRGGTSVNIENINVTTVAQDTNDIGREIGWAVRAAIL